MEPLDSTVPIATAGAPARQSFIRFALVGIINTVADISIYSLLRLLHFGIFPANICSTSVGLIISFTLNRHYTFQAHGQKLHQQLLRFFPVTLFGLWALQPLVINWLTHLDKTMHYSQLFPGFTHASLLIPKLGATVVSLIWNYVWYKKYVFA